MATLQSIRNRGGILISIVIGLALFAFVVGDAFSSGPSVFSSSRTKAGEIAGENVSIMEYQREIMKNEEMFKNMNGLTALNDEQQASVRENTWQQMIMDVVMNNEYEKLGIDVSGDELYDILLGNNMSPSIREMFGNAHPDEIRNYIRSLMDLPSANPQKAYWLVVEQQIAESQKQAKFNNLLLKGLYTTDAEVQQYIDNTTTKADISYILKSYSSISDSSITVSNNEIKEYYNANKSLYEQPELRRIAYVSFEVEPSPDDYTETRRWIEDLRNEFATSDNAGEFVDLSSDERFNPTYLKREEISNDSLASFLFENEGVYGPYLEDNYYKISRVADSRMLPDSVRARHILIAPENNDFFAAKELADSLANILRQGGDFESMARQYSEDQMSAVNGGDLGWFTANTMIQPFSDSVFFSNPRDIKVVVTPYGAHIVQLLERGQLVKKIQVATVEKEIIPSQATINKAYNNARSFADGIRSLDDFNKKIEETGTTKRFASLNKNDRSVAGMDNARELVRQVYLSKKENQVVLNSEGSNIFDTDDNFIIAVLTDIQEEGIAPVNNVASGIRQELIRKKKAEILKRDLESAASGSQSLLSVAQKAGLDVRDANDVSFSSFQIAGAGIEPNVIAAASLLPEGTISKPIEGTMGVYVILVNNRVKEEIEPELTEQVKATLARNNMFRATYQAFPALMKNAEIKDLRYKFY